MCCVHGAGVENTHAFRSALRTEHEKIHSEYVKKMEDLERERQLLSEDKSQIDRCVHNQTQTGPKVSFEDACKARFLPVEPSLKTRKRDDPKNWQSRTFPEIQRRFPIVCVSRGRI